MKTATITGSGSSSLTNNNLVLSSTQLPSLGSFAYYIVSDGNTPMSGTGFGGVNCLGTGTVYGRFGNHLHPVRTYLSGEPGGLAEARA